MSNIHATVVILNQKGILILGKSGSGKSDIALRLIESLKAILVADDRVEIVKENNELYACCPPQIKGLLEVRGIGLVSVKNKRKTKINLVVDLIDDYKKIERLPKKEYWEEQGVKIKKIKIYPFETSAIYKIRLACDEKEYAG